MWAWEWGFTWTPIFWVTPLKQMIGNWNTKLSQDPRIDGSGIEIKLERDTYMIIFNTITINKPTKTSFPQLSKMFFHMIFLGGILVTIFVWTPRQDGSYLAEFLLEKGYCVHGIIRRSSSFNTARIDHIFDKVGWWGDDWGDWCDM